MQAPWEVFPPAAMATGSSTMALQVKPGREETADRTQAMGPVAAEPAVRTPRVVCPECYASNPERNRYCHECGSPLPLASLGQTATHRTSQPPASPRRTAVLPAQTPEEVSPVAEYPSRRSKKGRARGERSFGTADALALLAVAILAAALIMPLFLGGFSYKRGTDLGMFSHQGAYVRGGYRILGGPGLLPYNGMEFLTVGLILSLGLFLAFLFLLVRAGRGPMFVLTGCLLLLPLAYLFFQAVLPLREMGVEIEPAVGLGRLFFGSDITPGLGPPVWMASLAGAILVLAGFLAPPRGWGRFLTFLFFFSLMVGAAFFCAACYNWNLFISVPAAATSSLPPFPGVRGLG